MREHRYRSNEYVVYAGSVTALLFTDYVYDPDAKDKLGDVMFGMMFLVMMVDGKESMITIIVIPLSIVQ